MGAGVAGSIIKGGTGLLTSGLGILGGNDAADALTAANDKAKTDLNAGYDKATGYQQPIYDKALGAYTNLNDRYAAGGFANPQMTPYKQDPNAVFQDPEYQAQMRAGTEAINSGAQSKGMLFSGINDRDLTKFGQDTFAGRSDALYKRGFDATNKAFDQNNTTNLNNFNEGHLLTQPLAGAASSLSNLSTERGGDLATLDLGQGRIDAGNINNTYSQIAGGINGLGDAVAGGLGAMDPSGMGGGNMVSLTGDSYSPTQGSWQNQVNGMVGPRRPAFTPMSGLA